MSATKLYLLATRKQYAGGHGVVVSLEKACMQAGITCERVVVEDVVLADISGTQFESGSLLYRVNTGPKACIIESMMVFLHPGVFTTIHHPRTLPLVGGRTYRELCEQIAQGLRIIPTLIVDETWQQMDADTLHDRVTSVDGFPVVVKELGFSHGQGVHKVDSVEDLQTLLSGMSFDEYGTILRRYLANYRHYRLTVVDGEVVAVIEYHKPADDFRTNATESPEVSALTMTEIPADLIQLAIDGVTLRQSLLGGVDILVDQHTNIGYLAEVNVPCYYPRAEGPTGVDISGKLLAAMIRVRDNRQR